MCYSEEKTQDLSSQACVHICDYTYVVIQRVKMNYKSEIKVTACVG